MKPFKTIFKKFGPIKQISPIKFGVFSAKLLAPILALFLVQFKVMNLRSDTFSNPLIQKVPQNYQSSPIIDVLECFAWLKIKHDFSK
jgi:hypothetical protein